MVGNVNMRGSLQPTLAREVRADDVVTVRRGDTLSEIAARYGVTLASLLAANPSIKNPDRILIGQVLKLPRAPSPSPSPPPSPRFDVRPLPSAERSMNASARRWPDVAVNIGAIQRRADVADGLARAAARPASAARMTAMSNDASTITGAELQQVVPGLSNEKADAVAQNLGTAMREANITTLRERAAFVAQLAHESGGFFYMEEIASGAQYEGRADLGNTQPGDGVRYKGRGYIQITGRNNYAQAGQALGLDLVNHPELAALPENAARIAAWYWSSRNINDPAERGDFVEVTRRINGGTNGLAERQRYYDRALNALTGVAPSSSGGAYVVAPGDTLSGIAARYGTSVDELMRLNPQLTSPDRINVGEELRLPGSAPPPPAIDAKFDAMGGASSVLGAPTTPDEQTTPDGAGRYKHYEGGSIYWTPQTGAHEVHGAIHDRWSELGFERGLGYPQTDEQQTPDGVGRFSVFERGSVYWSPQTGAHEVQGAIRDRYRDLGWEAGMLGYPVTGEQRSPDGAGRFSVFEHGSVYWSPTTGAHEVHGAIRDKYKELGWETGGLGYPTSDEYDVPEGRRSDFQNGSITWNKNTGEVTFAQNPGAPAVAPPVAPPAPPPPASPSTYTVQSGDTLSAIAARFGTSVGEIMRLNPQVTNPNVIQVGQVLQVPGAGAPPQGGVPSGDLVPNQFSLGGAVGMAACGPAALVALERAHGVNMPLQQAVDIARNYGWDTAGGMNGFGNFIAMARAQGLDFRSGSVSDVRAQVESGHPVVISTNQHYFVAQRFDPSTGKYFVGNSGTAMRAGSQWLSLDQMMSLGNGINGVGFAV